MLNLGLGLDAPRDSNVDFQENSMSSMVSNGLQIRGGDGLRHIVSSCLSLLWESGSLCWKCREMPIRPIRLSQILNDCNWNCTLTIFHRHSGTYSVSAYRAITNLAKEQYHKNHPNRQIEYVTLTSFPCPSSTRIPALCTTQSFKH